MKSVPTDLIDAKNVNNKPFASSKSVKGRGIVLWIFEALTYFFSFHYYYSNLKLKMLQNKNILIALSVLLLVDSCKL